MKLYDELKWRGLIDNVTSPDIEEALNNGGMTFYIGADPSGPSLHIGHYSSVIATVKRLKDAGHNPIIIAGGGTGLIGDPKPNAERAMLPKEVALKNIESIKKQVSSLLKSDVTVVNNADWLLEMNAIDYLRDYGKYFNINYMLAKDTVKRRLDIGITYTEFSYMILQSIDFLKLYEKHNCVMQIGGQDQWGNITAGLELIRKIHGADTKCYGFTMPLITRADGTKFGKSESGEALWLDRDMTSPYELYQYFINTEDEKVIEYIKKLTFLPIDEIIELEKRSKEAPEKREAQQVLAREIITFLHGENAYNSALKISDALFKGNIKSLTEEEIEDAFKDVPSFTIEENISLIDLIVNNNIASSKREAREFIGNGAITINDEKTTSEDTIIDRTRAINGKYIVVRRGKKKYYMFKF